ncbi:ATP-binding protein [Petropleomorpha daqingensis]|uniref:Orc1-like AAA ATPase domain-containing protein n=1 Tax=Petropleomorpha daqingensis TaxID=2026353 RepID=A0A853CMF7_9ACTN|nr:hypothetical protein [Petropleomorpha daqingensis]
MPATLVGRGPVLAAARAALEESLAGAGQLLLVSGEPGIGKSALLAVLSSEAAARGARVLHGSCWDGAAPAYWLWTQVLRSALEPGRLTSADLGAAARLLPADPASDAGEASPDPAEARFRLLDAVGETLARLAAQAPVVVVLDDLQWADEPSLQLLGFLVRRLGAAPVLLLGAYRDAEAGPAVRAVTAGAQHLPLLGLTRPEVAALMSAVGTPGPPSRVVTEVWQRTGGNPFLVRELTRLLLAQGGWGPDDGTPGLDAAVPDAVRDTLERRLARLSSPCAEALTAAAVAGPELRQEVLVRVVPAGAERPPLADLLAEAVAARVLLGPAEPSGRHRFSHDLYRETILAGLVPAARRDLHLAIGRALQAVAEAGGEVHPAEVADHLLAAGTAEAAADAVRFSAAAATAAMARLGYEEARRHYLRALAAADRLPGGDPAERLDLLLGLADARNRAGDAAGAREDLSRAAELSRRRGDVEGLARAAVALHGLGARGAGPEATATAALLREAAVGLPPEPSELRALVLTALVRSTRHQFGGTGQEHLVAAAEEAVAVARAVGEPSTLARALLALHDALWQSGSGPARLAVLDRMRGAAAADADLLALVHQLRAAALLESGDPRGRAELATYVELVAASGTARGRYEAMTRRATLAAIAGEAAEADRIAGEAFERGRAIGEADAAGVQGTLRGSLLVLGSPAAGRTSPAEFAAGAPSPAHAPVLRAVAQLARGETDRARQELTGFAVDDLPVMHDLEPLALLAAVVAPAGSADQRERVLARLLPYSGLHVVVGGCASYWGAVDHHLGALSAALGRDDDAARFLTSARTAYDRLGAPAWAQRCTEALAGLPSDRTDVPVFRFDGASWELSYRGRTVHLPDAKGIRDLTVLLAEPGTDVPALRLLGGEEAGGADPVLDDRARAAYRARLAELDAEIEEAEDRHDPARAERATAERQALVHELAAAAGLGGRTRRLGDRGERARKTVTARIRDALRRIEEVHPELGAHLRATVTTGTACSYAPEPQPAAGSPSA